MGKPDDLLKRVRGCIRSRVNSGSDHALDPSIDNGPWSAAKIQRKVRCWKEMPGTIVQVLFYILLRRQAGMLEKC